MFLICPLIVNNKQHDKKSRVSVKNINAYYQPKHWRRISIVHFYNFQDENGQKNEINLF